MNGALNEQELGNQTLCMCWARVQYIVSGRAQGRSKGTWQETPGL